MPFVFCIFFVPTLISINISISSNCVMKLTTVTLEPQAITFISVFLTPNACWVAIILLGVGVGVGVGVCVCVGVDVGVGVGGVMSP